MNKFMEFYGYVTEDSAAMSRLEALMSGIDAEDADKDAAMEKMIAFAKKEGFDFEMKELEAFLSGMSVTTELSKDELDAVAGGVKGVQKGPGACLGIGASTDKGVGGNCEFWGTTDNGKTRCVIIGVF